MALHLHRATRTDELAEGLARVLATPLPDPFAAELVVVPAKGIERWLSQRLSHWLGAGSAADGVCAAVQFRSPGSLIAELLGILDDDPWRPDALAWRVLGAVDTHLGEPWARPLARHLGAGREGEELELRQGRRYALARRIAGLFAAYAQQRPELLREWSAERDTDGVGEPMPDDLAWQPPLWRAVAAAADQPLPHERQADTVARLKERPESVDLPERLSLFGHTRLPAAEIELLGALAEQREVHLWLPHPSPGLWRELLAQPIGAPKLRSADVSHRSAHHPLLASLGRDVRELQQCLLGAAPDMVDDSAAYALGEGVVSGAAPTSPTLLSWLQDDVAANRAPDSAGRALAAADRSIQVHACHGPARQVEVLREVLLGLLADDPTLEPRDIVVMCPDIEAYAPLISACFGLADVVGHRGHPAHQLRVKLADRSLVQTNPLLSVAAALLDLAGGRATASAVLELAHAAPVRRRFAFRDDDLDQLAAWVADAGIRWAFDAQHRAPFGLQSFVQNTWRFGLDRILAGVTLSADSGGWLDRTLPLDDVGSGQIDLAGRFAEYVDRLAAVTDRLVGVHPLAHWLSALTDGIEALTAVSMADSWQPAQAQRELGAMATDTAAPGELRLADIRALLRGRLAGRPTRANFRTGSLTVCSMVPMRSVPHRVICLLGLDDGAFPRGAGRDGDDLLARDPLVGERDPRAEDRQLMLDALCAAKDAVVITYTGSDVYTGQPRPPAVPLGELLDALDLTAVAAEGRVQEAITIHHPLQPFDVRNVAVGALVPGEPFSFDPSAAAGARAMSQARVAPLDWRTVRLPALDAASLGEGSLGAGSLGAHSLGEETLGLAGVGAAAAEVRLDDLLTFFRSPARGFFKQRLEVDLPFEEKPLSDGLHVEIDSLEQWAVGERVLADLLAGIGPEEAKQREWRRGFLPPGQLGWRQLRGIVDQAVPLAREALGLRERAAYAVDVDVDLGGGRRLSGTVGEIYRGRLVPVSFSRLGPAHRLRSWINLLAVTAQDPDHNYTAHTIGRPGNRQETVAISRLGPIDDRSAAAHLRDLVTLYDEGRRRPLPLPVKSSCAYAEYRRSEASVGESLKAASKRWQDDRFKGEQSDAEQVRLYGRRASLPGTRKADWGDLDIPSEPGETAPFGALAMRLWRPLLEAENQPW